MKIQPKKTTLPCENVFCFFFQLNLCSIEEMAASIEEFAELLNVDGNDVDLSKLRSVAKR